MTKRKILVFVSGRDKTWTRKKIGVRYFCNRCGSYHYGATKISQKHVEYRDKPFGDYKEL